MKSDSLYSETEFILVGTKSIFVGTKYVIEEAKQFPFTWIRFQLHNLSCMVHFNKLASMENNPFVKFISLKKLIIL